MMCLCWRAMNWVVPVPLSMRFALRMVSLSRNGSGIYLHPFRGGTCLPQGYAGSRSNLSEPIPVVQCGCPGLEERWYSALLHRLQVPQCLYEEGLVPLAPHSGGLGKHGRVGTFLVNGFQVGLLANQDGPRIATVNGLHGG